MQAAAAGHSTMDVVRDVVQRDGFLGLYRGATPGVIRSSVLTATQCATYDEVKRYVMSELGWKDGISVQLVTGLTTGEGGEEGGFGAGGCGGWRLRGVL